jgi:hypothetical protein
MRARQFRLAGPFVLPTGFSEAAPFETTVTRPLAQRHRAETSREQISPTTSRGGQWELSNEGETDMTSAVVGNIDEIRELTIDELDEAGGGLSRVVLGLAVAGIILASFGAGVGVGALLLL